MRVYGLPNQSETRLLGKEDHYTWKSEGVAAGFCDLSHLTPTEQNCRPPDVSPKTRDSGHARCTNYCTAPTPKSSGLQDQVV